MKAALLSAALALTACHAHKVTYETRLPRGKVHSEWTGHFFAGHVGHTEMNVRRICPQGVAKIETYRSVGNGFIGALTLGIYTPRTVRITCAAGGSVIAELNKDGNIRFAIRENATTEVMR